MPKSSEPSPIFRFLVQKDNLPAVLDVVRYAEEIRDYVANRFWDRLEEAIKANPKALPASFAWARKFPTKGDGFFNVIARPPGLSEKGQGLKYMFETNPEYFGMGIAWNEDAHGQTDKLCKLEPIKRLQAELRKRLPGDIEPEPNRWWLWWEYWQRNPYTDPWSWFASDLDDTFFNDLAKKFWDLLLPVHPVVSEANKALGRIRS